MQISLGSDCVLRAKSNLKNLRNPDLAGLVGGGVDVVHSPTSCALNSIFKSPKHVNRLNSFVSRPSGVHQVRVRLQVAALAPQEWRRPHPTLFAS